MTTLSTPRGRSALVVSVIVTSLATAVLLVRIYTRAILVKQMGSDDYAILVALTLSWIFFGLFVGEVYHGVGEHYMLIPQPIFRVQMLYFWASVPVYQASLIVTKMSILFQYRRVFSIRRIRLACNLLIGFLVVYGTWAMVSAWVTCVPLAKFWDPEVAGFCFDKKGLWLSNSAIHVLTDVMILIYPMPALSSLQLPKRQKFALIGVFTLGGFVLIASLLRLKALLVITDSTDPTYDNVGAAQWSAIECNVAIICASLPSTRAFISKLLPHIFSTRSNGYCSSRTWPSRTGRSHPRHTITNAHVQASVFGGCDNRDDDLNNLLLSDIFSLHERRNDNNDSFGIKVTTSVTKD